MVLDDGRRGVSTVVAFLGIDHSHIEAEADYSNHSYFSWIRLHL